MHKLIFNLLLAYYSHPVNTTNLKKKLSHESLHYSASLGPKFGSFCDNNDKMADSPPNLNKLAYGKKMNFFAIRKLVFLNANLNSTQNSRQFLCIPHLYQTSSSRITHCWLWLIMLIIQISIQHTNFPIAKKFHFGHMLIFANLVVVMNWTIF